MLPLRDYHNRLAAAVHLGCVAIEQLGRVHPDQLPVVAQDRGCQPLGEPPAKVLIVPGGAHAPVGLLVEGEYHLARFPGVLVQPTDSHFVSAGGSSGKSWITAARPFASERTTRPRLYHSARRASRSLRRSPRQL